ncbi:hypothetical protein MTBPR1_220013 [Candidatus Terasakiella magnetica]|uniref:Uncharacterized protein n=1 Tax=Candidatus Terasakiella magnetica TaxID=1867952 RepID=A0A1C3RH35_9PROT|nr:hypothetical protein MTBPR1_220013 [Candidatus Terasakiella magnetica]
MPDTNTLTSGPKQGDYNYLYKRILVSSLIGALSFLSVKSKWIFPISGFA